MFITICIYLNIIYYLFIEEREKRKKKYYGDMDDETNDAENDEDFNVISQEKAKRQSRFNMNSSKSNLPIAQTTGRCFILCRFMYLIFKKLILFKLS